MSQTQVLNSDEARQVAAVARQLADEMFNLQKTIETRLNAIPFSGRAADAAKLKMNEYKTKIEGHKVSLEQYSNTLQTFANNTDANEQSAISGLPA